MTGLDSKADTWPGRPAGGEGGLQPHGGGARSPIRRSWGPNKEPAVKPRDWSSSSSRSRGSVETRGEDHNPGFHRGDGPRGNGGRGHAHDREVDAFVEVFNVMVRPHPHDPWCD